MTAQLAGHERVYRGLLHLYPPGFRARFGDEMVQLFGDQLRRARATGPPAAVAGTWLRAITDLAVTATSERIRRDRTVGHSLTVSPSNSSRLLGLIGIVGGFVLLLPAFLPVLIPFDLSPDLFNLRLAMFNIGAIAIVAAVHRRQGSAAPAVAMLTAVLAVLANAWYLALTVLAVSQPGQLGPGDFGQMYFFAGAAMWLTDAAFGLVTLRLSVLARWGALALAIGSVLAFTGMDQLGLTSGDNPTIFGPLSLVGIVLNGLGWILLGLDVATRRRAVEAQPDEVRPEG
jgi:hypothetical protein